MEITISLSQDLADRLRPVGYRLPEILELGMREWRTLGGTEFAGLASVLEVLASLPSPEEILALRPTAEWQDHLEALVERAHLDTLSTDEERELTHYQFVEHLVRMAKSKALLKLQGE